MFPKSNLPSQPSLTSPGAAPSMTPLQNVLTQRHMAGPAAPSIQPSEKMPSLKPPVPKLKPPIPRFREHRSKF